MRPWLCFVLAVATVALATRAGRAVADPAPGNAPTSHPAPARFGGYVGIDSYGKKAVGLARAFAGLKMNSVILSGDHLEASASSTLGWRNAVASYVTPPGDFRIFSGGEIAATDTIDGPDRDEFLLWGEIGAVTPGGFGRLAPLFSGLGFLETGSDATGRFRDERGFGVRTGWTTRRAGDGAPWDATLAFQTIGWWDRASDGMQRHLAVVGSISADQPLGFGLALRLETAAQWSFSGQAPHAYRLTLSGPFAVRGYDGDLFGADSGVVLRSEWRAEAASFSYGGWRATPYILADAGSGWERAEERARHAGTLASVGAGLALKSEIGVTGTVYLATPLLSFRGAEAGSPIVRGSLLWSF